MKGLRRTGAAILTFALSAIMVSSNLAVRTAGDETRGGEAILVVGQFDHMKTRNPLPFTADDVWTRDVMDRVYDTVGKSLPFTDQLVPYLVKGIDADGDGKFEEDERGVFGKPDGGDQLNVTAYYDFNGVYFHDGKQADAGDLFFSYQLQAMNPRRGVDLMALMDKAGRAGSNYSQTRWLFVTPAVKDWENETAVGNPSLRFAVRFSLQEPFFLFYRVALAGCVLYPRHVWEGVGWRYDTASGAVISPLHPDFGVAIYPEGDARFGRGVPTTETILRPFRYLDSSTPDADSAEEWQLMDRDVIGTGPFRFDSFNEAAASALVLRNLLFYAGRDAKTGMVLDPFVSTYLNQPHIDGIMFTVYGSMTMGVLALRGGYVDYYHWGLAPEYIPDLMNDPDIRLYADHEPGFFFVGYDMRRPALGVWHYGQGDQFDIGLHMRRAIAHVIDKASIVRENLHGYGIPGVVPVSPQNARFYNSSLVPYSLNESVARDEIALAHQDALWLANNGGPPEAATWYTRDVKGMLILPGIGNASFTFYCGTSGYRLQAWDSGACARILYSMARLGLNVQVKPIPDPPLFDPQQMDIFAMPWRLPGDDPDYLYDLFHSSQAAMGRNIVGFNDPLLDSILDASRTEMNETRRIELFKWAQGVLLEKLPYDVVYFRNNIEAVNQERFVGWISVGGTIWNYWSLLSLRQPSNARISVTIETPSAIASKGSTGIFVSVKDDEGAPVIGAKVSLSLAPDVAGNFTAGGSPARNYSGAAALGSLSVQYAAPGVSSLQNVTIIVTARHPDFPAVPEASRTRLVAVYPVGVKFLAVTVKPLDSDIVPSSDSIRFGLSVMDESGFPVQHARVDASIVPAMAPPYGLTPANGNATDMSMFTFHAPPASVLELNETLIVLSVNATAPGGYDGGSTAGFIVVKLYRSCPDGSHVPDDLDCESTASIALYIVVATAILITVAVASVLIERKMRPKGKEPPRT